MIAVTRLDGSKFHLNSDQIETGDDGEIQRAVAPGVKLGVNITGDRVFPQVLDVRIGVRDDLRVRAQQSLSEDRLDELGAVHDGILDALGEVGAKGARLEITKRQLSAGILNDAELISRTEDVEMSDAIINLSAQQAALQASLATGARVIQPKLMDFLRWWWSRRRLRSPGRPRTGVRSFSRTASLAAPSGVTSCSSRRPPAQRSSCCAASTRLTSLFTSPIRLQSCPSTSSKSTMRTEPLRSWPILATRWCLWC